MKHVILIFAIALGILNLAVGQEKTIQQQLKEIALDEGIVASELYKFRKANLKLTRKPIEGYRWAYYNVPADSDHEAGVHFKEHNGERYYKTVQEMYEDACKFFYHQGKFLIPEYDTKKNYTLKERIGKKLDQQEKTGFVDDKTKFVCNKGKCGLVGDDSKTITEKELVEAIQDQVDIIKNVVLLSNAKDAYRDGYDVYYSETLGPYLSKIATLERKLATVKY